MKIELENKDGRRRLTVTVNIGTFVLINFTSGAKYQACADKTAEEEGLSRVTTSDADKFCSIANFSKILERLGGTESIMVVQTAQLTIEEYSREETHVCNHFIPIDEDDCHKNKSGLYGTHPNERWYIYQKI